MDNHQLIADRVEIEALRGEFADAAMVRDYDRFASLFTTDGAWRMPHGGFTSTQVLSLERGPGLMSAAPESGLFLL